MEKFGIKELSEAVVFGIQAAESVGAALADGIDMSDLVTLLPVVMSAPSALAGITEIPAELSDISEEEIAAIVELVNANLGSVDNEKAKAVGLKAVQLSLIIAQLIVLIKEAKAV